MTEGHTVRLISCYLSCGDSRSYQWVWVSVREGSERATASHRSVSVLLPNRKHGSRKEKQKKPLSIADEDKIIAKINAGETQETIMKQTGIAERTFCLILATNDEIRKDWNSFSPSMKRKRPGRSNGSMVHGNKKQKNTFLQVQCYFNKPPFNYSCRSCFPSIINNEFQKIGYKAKSLIRPQNCRTNAGLISGFHCIKQYFWQLSEFFGNKSYLLCYTNIYRV